jgi:fumarate hydratase subunit beta
MIRIDLPVSEQEIRRLEVGDEVSLHGVIVTARDAAHKLFVESWPGFVAPLLEGGAIYHCGPVMIRDGKLWKAVAAGPTTSIREEPYEAAVIEHYKVRLVIGKGGMGPSTLAACKKVGAVYVHAIGGAAPLIADTIVRTREVHLLEQLGVPEALWVYEVSGFKGVVTMDAAGRSLHDDLFAETKIQRDRLLGLASTPA